MSTRLAEGKARVGYVLDERVIRSIRVEAASRDVRPSVLAEQLLRRALAAMPSPERETVQPESLSGLPV
jgi:hypothetical protein